MRHECLRHAIALGKALILIADRIDSAEDLVARVRQYRGFSPSPCGCTVRGHSEHLFGDMVDTYN